MSPTKTNSPHHRSAAPPTRTSAPTSDHTDLQPVVTPNEIAQLQRSLGNQAIAALVQTAPPARPPGAQTPSSNQMIALQRAMGNHAVTHLFAPSATGDSNTVQRVEDTVLTGLDSMRKDPHAPPPLPPRPHQHHRHHHRHHHHHHPQPPPGFLEGIRPGTKAPIDPDHADIIEDLSLTSTTTDAIGSLLSSAGGTTESALYDSIYKSFLEEQRLPPDTQPSDLTPEQIEELQDREVEGGGLRTITGDSGIRTDLGIASSGLGIGIGGFTAFAGFFGFIDAWKKYGTTTDPAKRAELIMELISQGTVATIGTLQTTSSIGGTVSGAVSKYDAGNEAATAASNSFSGLGDLFGGLGGLVETFMSGIKAIKGSVALFKGIGEGSKRDQALQVAKDFIVSGKAFLMTGKSAISGAKAFLDVVGKANAFTSAVPIVGAAINIVVQFVDIAVQVVDGVREAIKLAIARRTAEEMRKLHEDEAAKGTGASQDKLAFLKKMIEINYKRVRRAIIPVVTAITNGIASVISIAGSILNIVGAATSAAYGAGLAIMAGGYAASGTSALMRLGGSAAKPIAAGVRKLKQKGRDYGAKHPGGRFAKMFNTEKSSEKKLQDYIANVQRLFNLIMALPEPYDPGKPQEKQQYEEVFIMINATGADTKELFALNGDPQKQMLLLVEAMQTRE